MKPYNFDQHFYFNGTKYKLNSNIKQTYINKMLKVMRIDSLPLYKKDIIEHYFNMLLIHGGY